ncbi:DUF1491 family protein [Rhizobium pusense]|jgi:hypothetical protein|uniref:DUF1491 family protein n=3 Tax=Agrobacterium TaxID=357 RepID=A0AA44EMK9_9HYPH|nr:MULTISPECIES: DUF1491 family protein [Rhizobium/Agrobacterium group]MBM7329942.1 DUF1491 family protein [Agrobacterium sp. S2]HCJ74821.1 DUF1491 domain-containing protein [Agrobacterium sp.]MCJ2873553.1 DUF1491 family protein [Agrobacterium pusense]MCW8282751.1 DUF1491 family protein [Agrobacterium sp. InxBP2]MDH0909839.1 DUF1491 family protein [Agrobacterium pusense]
MRLKSEMFVSALIRRVFAAGGFAAVEKKGAEEAGAIFVRQRLRDGRENLYGPAPQSFAEDEDIIRAERRFETRLAGVEGEESAALLERERRFDSDLWVVEIETDDIGTLLTLVDQPKA